MQLIGRAGKDPETRTFDNGGKVTNLTLATSEKYRDKSSGELRESTDWHNLVFRGRTAEVVEQYVRKGSQIYVTGRISYRSYEGQDGQKRYVTEIICFGLELLGGKAGRQEDNGPADSQEDDDLPF